MYFSILMKFIAAPILILLVMTHILGKWTIIAAFNFNREYISRNVCENRFRPVLKCKGNCLLMKKMKQEEKKEQNSPGAVKTEASFFTFSSRSFFATVDVPVFTSNITYTRIGNSGKPVDRQAAIFHPPSA